ncbi:hypothetical protein [Novosphingopyxis baekryungensis]|nr:hypothetical protein [Novosphingopyxis baekryungensis]
MPVIGAFPDVGWSDAREAMDNARKLLKEGCSPKHAIAKKHLIGEMSFH